jgi:hypothetical protein
MPYLLWTDLSLSMLLLFVLLLQLPTPLNLRTYKDNFQSFARIYFLQNIQYHYDNLLERLNVLNIRRCHSDELFLINVHNGAVYCLSFLKTADIPVPARNKSNCSTFSCSLGYCPSPGCASAVVQFVN